MSKFDLENIKQMSQKTIANVLGMSITHVSKGRVEGTMPVDERTHQPYGLLHGGASVTLAETLASLGGWVYAEEEGKTVVGQEINANHLRAVKSGNVTGIAEPVYIGKKSQVWEIKIRDDQQKLVCVSRCTLAVIDPL